MSLADDIIRTYRGREAAIEARPMQELQQVGALQGILAKVQAAKQEQELRGVLSQSGGDPAKAVQALLQAGTPQSIELASKLKGMMPPPAGDFTLGADQTRFNPAGKVIAAGIGKDPKEAWSEPYQLGGATVQKNSVNGQIRTAVTRGPQFKVTQEAPVTPITIQDPNDASATIIIDGRTKRVLGKGPKMTQAGAIDAKTSLMMTGLGSDLQTAEDLLTGVTRTSDGQVVKGNLPTGSGIGSVYDAAAGFFGASPAGAAEADSLKTVAARLVSRIPRFEGPQSDKDVKLYQTAAGDAGNDKLPRGRRLAAIKTMSAIYQGYESGQRGRLIGNRRSGDGADDEPPEGAVRRRGG